jgi:uncharacterized protein involved in exopolysaccharide biosynthesis
VPEPARESSLRDILYTLFKHKWKVAGFFLVITIGVGIATLLATPVYESSAKLFVRVGRESIGVDPTVAGPTISIFQSRESEINSEIEIIKNRSVAEQVVETLGPGYILGQAERDGNGTDLTSVTKNTLNLIRPSNTAMGDEGPDRFERAILSLQSRLGVNSRYNNNMIFMSYQDSSPERAQTVLDTVIEAFLEKHIEVHRSSGSYQFFLEETNRLKQELQKTENELKELRSSIDIVSLDEQRTIMLRRIADLEDTIESTQTEIVAARASIEAKKRNLDPALNDEQARLQSLIATLESLKRRREQIREQLDTLNSSEFRLRQLERRAQVQDENYRRYLENLEMARISQALEEEKLSNISIVQSATLPVNPISPKEKRNLGIGLLLGLGFGLLTAFVSEYFDHRLKKPDEAEEALGVVTSSIPNMNTSNVARELRSSLDPRLKKNYQIARLAGDVTVWIYMVQSIRESFENIRDRLAAGIGEKRAEENPSARKPFVLAVTSAYRGEGVTSVATGIAYTVSLFDEQNVLLVDSNLHHPDTDSVSGLNRPPGLYEISVRRPDLADTADVNTLFQEKSPQLPQVMSSETYKTLIPSVEKMDYQLIVLDLPSIYEGASATKTAAMADGVLLVVESEGVRREVVVKVKDKLERAGANLMGVVLNKQRFYIPKWLYQRV